MPTDKPRITFVLPEDVLRAVDEYRYSNRIRNQSQAIVQLIRKGLEVIGEQPYVQTESFTQEETELIHDFRSLPKRDKELIHVLMDKCILTSKSDTVPTMEKRA